MDICSKDKVDLSGFRVPYLSEDVKRDFSARCPFQLFDMWFNTAMETKGIREANAMALATATEFGIPSVRYVLLKGYGHDGFRFFTNYNSRKGKEILDNPHVSLLFYWEPLCRQIRIEGTAVKLSFQESEDYFHSRPRSSQISAVVSKQSEVIEGKEVLLQKKKQLEDIYSDDSTMIPKPESWGGFLVKPSCFEFWCGRSDRLHDRIKFRRPNKGEIIDEVMTHTAENGWIYEYLSP